MQMVGVDAMAKIKALQMWRRGDVRLMVFLGGP